MKIIESILTNNPCYTAGRKITVKGLMLHSVGCPQPSAMVFVNKWNKTTYNNACVHAFIDANDGTIYQTLPWNHRGWHGGGSSNNTHIGVEMCEPGCINYTSGANFTCSNPAKAKEMAKRTYEAAVELFASLCKEFGLDPLGDGVIVSHKEGGKRGIASGHVDPEHLWSGLGLSYTMNTFRQAVKAAMGGGITAPEASVTAPASGQIYRVRKSWADAKSQIGAFKNLESAKKMADENTGYEVYDEDGGLVYAPASVTNYKVKITASVLNVRAGAGTFYKVNMCVNKGEVYTIVEEKNGWGRLKSGAGWISLQYTARV